MDSEGKALSIVVIFVLVFLGFGISTIRGCIVGEKAIEAGCTEIDGIFTEKRWACPQSPVRELRNANSDLQKQLKSLQDSKELEK